MARHPAILTRHIDRIEANIRSKEPATAAAQAMRTHMVKSTARYIGADLKLSGFRGDPVDFPTTVTPDQATLTLAGGTYAIADLGRPHGYGRMVWAKPRKQPGERRSALDTPRGFRRSLDASKGQWGGFRITDRHAQDALDAGVAAAIEVIERLAVK